MSELADKKKSDFRGVLSGQSLAQVDVKTSHLFCLRQAKLANHFCLRTDLYRYSEHFFFQFGPHAPQMINGRRMSVK